MFDQIPIVVIILIVTVVVALALGLFFFTREGMDQRRRSNLMMRWRVGLQLAAVLALFAFAVLFGGG